MSSNGGLSASYVIMFSLAVSGAFFAMFGHLLPGVGNLLSSSLGQAARQQISTLFAQPSNNELHEYQTQIFSRDPLIVYIRNFVSSDEIDYLLQTSEDKYQPSKVYGGLEDSQVDAKMRVSESAYLDFKDPVVARIARRARMFQGWRGNATRIEPVSVQRYNVDGFYNYHFDWDEALSKGNRATTFMSYLTANCTGGGTNFPFLPQPSDERWCDVIECDEEGRDGYQGVIFKPILGSAVFWENFYPNGTGHKGVYHAGLPITSGTKVGLNIWSWDSAWVKPE